jgi:hypothetical protein
MKTKWYFSTFIIIFTFLGICYNHISLPNQEIVVQFNSNEVTAEQSEKAITIIKSQLHEFGIEQVYVVKQLNGEIKFSYRSSLDVASIKNTLTEIEFLEVNSTSDDRQQKKSNKKNYDFDVYEIHKTKDSNSNSAGKFVIITKQEFDRYVNTNLTIPQVTIENKLCDLEAKVLEKINRNNVHITNTISHNIPEVRAGPLYFGNI